MAPVLGMHEAPGNAHLAARRTFTSVDGVVQATPAPRFSAAPVDPPHRPNDTGLPDWGVSPADLDALRAAGVIH